MSVCSSSCLLTGLPPPWPALLSMRMRMGLSLALSAWKEGKASDALKLFQQISNDDQAPQNARQRAGMMAELIRGSGVTS